MDGKSIYNEKKLVRSSIRLALKLRIPDELQALSSKIFLKLEQQVSFINAKNIMIYWSLPSEVYTHDAIQAWSKDKAIYLPCIEGDNLIAKQFKDVNDLIPASPLKIPEPLSGKTINPSDIDLIIVPGLAFDSNNNRLGKGKGYYDKFLSTTNAVKIGICFSFQLIPNVPVCSFDIPMDMVLTEE